MAGRIAIYGGSFNPIHTAHLKVACCALEECSLDKVIFLPNARPPHKDAVDMISAEHRYNMVSLAISDYDRFEISDYEMNRDRNSYTIDTMRYMKSKTDAELFFIIGADSLYTLNKWKSYESLIRECRFIVADRNCDEGSDLKSAADEINRLGGSVTLISMPKTDVTSTMIRDCISGGGDVSAYLPDKVNDYIRSNKLYKSNSED